MVAPACVRARKHTKGLLILFSTETFMLSFEKSREDERNTCQYKCSFKLISANCAMTRHTRNTKKRYQRIGNTDSNKTGPCN